MMAFGKRISSGFYWNFLVSMFVRRVYLYIYIYHCFFLIRDDETTSEYSLGDLQSLGGGIDVCVALVFVWTDKRI